MGKAALTYFVVAVALCIGVCKGQENIQTRIPDSLIECYQRQDVFQRDSRLPSNINMLIELIRKVEDAVPLQAMQQIATSLVHRFRVDGIERAPGVFQNAGIIPFSPSGFQFSKHRLLLSRLVPGNAMAFPNNTLNEFERCALHFMLSSSIETQVRGDEGTMCSQLAQYRSVRTPRNVHEALKKKRSVPFKNNFLGDVEMLSPSSTLEDYHRRNAQKMGRYQDENEEDEGLEENPTAAEDPEINVRMEGEEEVADEGIADEDMEGLDRADVALIDVASNAISQCPVENGAIWTTWGAVNGGALITGIAAGLVPQNVTTRDLLALSRSQYASRQTNVVLSVDNRWAATLSGDLAELSLLQGPAVQNQAITVGASGAWNSTIPHWYFLSQRERFEMTDAEIRGGLDGLILALDVQAWMVRANTLRLSQLLEMYYSQRGVFSSDRRACDRRALFTSVAPLDLMQAQAIAFSTVLDKEMQLRVTLSTPVITTFANAASQQLTTYIPASLNDLSCAATLLDPMDPTLRRIATDVFIFVDTTWTFREIQPVLAHMLENMDVNRFGSNYTLLNANNGNLIVGPFSSLAEFYLNYTMDSHLTHTTGFNLPNVLRTIHVLGGDQLEQERLTQSVGGRSQVAIIMPQLGTPNEADTQFSAQFINVIHEENPDMHILFFGGGTIGRFGRFVREESLDLFTLTSVTGAGPLQSMVNPVVARVRQIPRRIINHRCGQEWQTNEWGSNQMNQHVEPGAVVFFRVHPNYFFHGSENRRIRVVGLGYQPVTVCTSRQVVNPRQNATTNAGNDVNCQQVNTDTFTIELSNACEGHTVIHHCPPMFISIEGSTLVNTGAFRCIDMNCRFPDDIRFVVHADNLGCFSSATKVLSTITLMIVSALLWLNF